MTKIVHAGSPENFVYYYTAANDLHRAEYLLSSGERKDTYNTLSDGKIIKARNWNMYKDKELDEKGYIKNVHLMTYDEAQKGMASDIGECYWLASANAFTSLCYVDSLGYHNNLDYYCCWGIRPVVEMNDGVYIASGTGSYTDPYVLGKD